MVTFPTRANNILDLFFTSNLNKLISIRPTPPLSDHNTIIVYLDLSLKRKPQSQNLINKWNKGNVDELSKEVAENLKN